MPWRVLPPSPRPSPRRRPLGGAGVRAGGRADPARPRPDRESTVAPGVVLARGVPRARVGWSGTDGPVVAPRRTGAASAARVAYAVRWLELGDGRSDRDGPSSSPSAPDTSEAPRPVSFADAPVAAVLHHPPRRPGRCRDAVAPAPRSGPATSASSARGSTRSCRSASASTSASSRSSARRWTGSASQEIEMPVVHPADVWKASGRYDAIGPELTRFKDRNGRDMVLAMTHEEVVGLLLADIVKLVPPAADDGLPLPDQVARRAALARRAHPRPRVRDEGRLQLRPRRRGPRRQLRGAARRVRPDLRAARARHRRRRRPTSGSWAAARPTSSWSSTRPARTSSSCARRAATRPTGRSRSCPSPSPPTRTPSRSRRSRRRARRPSRRSPRSSASGPTGRPRRPSS